MFAALGAAVALAAGLAALLTRLEVAAWLQALVTAAAFLAICGIAYRYRRVALALLELCSDFGVEDSRGTLLRAPFSHKDIAELVGASRPRVTEHLAKLERDRFILRQGRQLIVHAGKLSDSMAARAA